jgi:Rha family phage regulatory protein
MTDTNLQTAQPIELSVSNDHPRAASLQIARHFGKRHADVLRSIEDLKANLPPEWHERNFAFMSTTVEIGNGAARQDPACLMTRDGFCLLVMGFTGKKALAWKIKYIEAFNELEAGLRQKTFEKYLPLAAPRRDEDERAASGQALIDGLLGYWANQDRLPYKTAAKWLCAHLGISGLDDFTEAHFSPAWDFLISAACFLEREEQPITPEQKKNIERLLSACAWFKHSRDLEPGKMLRGLCGASLDNVPAIDPAKATGLAWGLFQYARGYSRGYARGQETIIQDLVR